MPFGFFSSIASFSSPSSFAIRLNYNLKIDLFQARVAVRNKKIEYSKKWAWAKKEAEAPMCF
jgi:hypothetical protein